MGSSIGTSILIALKAEAILLKMGSFFNIAVKDSYMFVVVILLG